MVKRYRSMDLLRAVAILMVLLAHAVFTYGAPISLAPLQLGGNGVDLFFVLSGWLLGGQLFKESLSRRTIDVKRFWMRRWMRTFPAYFVVLIILVLQRYLTKENVDFPWQYFIFIQNYYFPLDFFSISWSLGVEEQFYLFVALLLSILTRTRKEIVTVILFIILLLPFVFRELDYYSNPKETHVRLDCCVMGVFLAHIFYQYRPLWDKAVKFAPAIAILALVLYIGFYIARYFPELEISDPDKLLLAVIFGSWVVLSNASNYWSDMLYFPGANYIATRSYSLYLVHPEILAIQKRVMLDFPFLAFYAVTVVGGLLLAELLYRFVEQPVMNSRENFSFSKKLNKQ